MANKNTKFEPKGTYLLFIVRSIYRILILLAGFFRQVAPLFSQPNDQKPSTSLLQQEIKNSPSESIISKQISSFQLSKNRQVLVPLPRSFKTIDSTSTVHLSNDVKSCNPSMWFGGNSQKLCHETSSQRSEGMKKFGSIVRCAQ